MKIRTEMWVLTWKSRPVRDEWGAYVMAAKLIDAEALAYKRGQGEVPKKFVLRLERI
jgi:hypothetical protein